MMSYEQQLKDQREAYSQLLKYVQEFVKHEQQAARAMSDFAREIGSLHYSNACPQALKAPFSQLSEFAAEVSTSIMGIVEACSSQYECFAMDFRPMLEACQNARRAQIPFIEDSNKVTLESALQFEQQRLTMAKRCNIELGRAFSAFSAGICELSGKLEISGRMIYEEDARLAVATQFQAVDFGQDVYALCGVQYREYRTAPVPVTKEVQKSGKERQSGSSSRKTPREAPASVEERSYRIIDEEYEHRFTAPGQQSYQPQPQTFQTPPGQYLTPQNDEYKEYPEFTPGYRPKSSEFSIEADRSIEAPRTERYGDQLLFQPETAPGRLLSVQEIDLELQYLQQIETNMRLAGGVGSPQTTTTFLEEPPEMSTLNQRSDIISPEVSGKPIGYSPAAFEPENTAPEPEAPQVELEPAEEAVKPQIITEEVPKKKKLQPKAKEIESLKLDFEDEPAAAKPDAKKKKLPKVDIDNLL